MRVAATALGSDARFVVTSLNGRGTTLYDKVYCARGRMENLIKDLKLYTRAPRRPPAIAGKPSSFGSSPCRPLPTFAWHPERTTMPVDLACSDLRGDPEGIREDRSPRPGDEKLDQDRVPGQLSVRAYACPVYRLQFSGDAVTLAAQIAATSRTNISPKRVPNEFSTPPSLTRLTLHTVTRMNRARGVGLLEFRLC